MKILAIEFSSSLRSVAVGDSDVPRVVGAYQNEQRSTKMISLIEQVLANAGIARESIGCLAIGLGPGSYTGIRAAIAFAQGWQLGRPVRLLGISSVDVLMRQAKDSHFNGALNIVIDAQRNEFYMARYRLSEDAVQELEALHLSRFEEVQSRIDRGEATIGPDLAKRVNGAVDSNPTAEVLVRLAAERNDDQPGECLEPIALRRSEFVKAPPPRKVTPI